MSTHNEVHLGLETGETVLCTIDESRAIALVRILAAAGIDCRLTPDASGFIVLVEESDAELAELVLAKRKKDVEDEEESDDEDEEEDEDDLDDDSDEDDFEDEEDDFEEEFDDDELDDDDDDIFYDDDDDE